MSVVLFDVDGTLIRSGNRVHRDAFTHALATVYGVECDVRSLNPGGRTDRWLLLEALQRAGVEAATAQAGVEAAFACMNEYYVTNAEDLRPYVLDGVPALLSRLGDNGFLLGLLTGNLETIALTKMARAGIDDFFQFGGYGSESVVRADLIDVAMAKVRELRDGPVDADQVVVIGDTPHDVDAGKHHGMWTIAVATGPYDSHALEAAAADLVAPNLEDAQSIVRWMCQATGHAERSRAMTGR